MKKIASLLIIILFITSCKNEEYETKLFDLSKLNFNLNPDKFYSKSLKRENIKLTSTIQYVEKDSISEYDLDMNGDKNKLFGIQYNVKGYSPKDTVATYNNLFFNRLEAMTDNNNDLMLISATGECSPQDFKDFLANLTKKYQKPTIEKKEFSFFKTFHYTWNLEDRIVQLVSNTEIDFEQTPHNILSEKDKKEITEIEKGRLEEIHLFIGKLDFEKKLRGKLNGGNWSDFK